MSTATLTKDPSFSWLDFDYIEDVLSLVNPMFSIKRVKAKVTDIIPLADDMLKVVLSTNHAFKGFQAGQYVAVSLKIKGITQQRMYSIVEYSQKRLVLGIKKQGLVSRYIATELKQGDVLDISPAQGEFVFIPTVDNKRTPLLLIASGSGITPMFSIIETALRANDARPVTLVYFSRDPAYLEKLMYLAHENPFFNLKIINTSTEQRHFDQALLSEVCSDYAQCETYVCGHPSLMQAVQTIWQKAELTDRLTMESFVPTVVTQTEDSAVMPVVFRRSQRTIETKGVLLASAESAGLTPAYGCRMGMCNSCVCTKVNGSTRNVLTGEVSHQPNTQIKICISEAITPVTLDL